MTHKLDSVTNHEFGVLFMVLSVAFFDVPQRKGFSFTYQKQGNI